MNVLFSCVPGFGHFHPLVPLARALTGAGHRVAFATAERFCRRVIEPEGFPAFPAGLPPHVAHQATLELPEAAERDPDDVWTEGALMFAKVAGPAKVDALAAAIAAFTADLVIHDPTDFAGPLAAAGAGIAWAAQSFGAIQPPPFWQAGGALIAPEWRRRGLEPDDRGGMFAHLYLDICPPSFQDASIAGIEVARPLRPVTYDTSLGSALPGWVEELDERPTVYVTLGTVANHATEVFDAVLGGLGEAEWNVIVTIGPDRHPAELGPQPAHVHIEGYLPQSLLFGRCDVVVCHGGSGTLLAALGRGLPLLVLPQGANQFWNARRCVELGVGLALTDGELAPPAVRSAVAALVHDARYRDGAARLAAEIAAMPAPAEVVPKLEALARRGP
ncbi:MAG TPA: glycosyltransferase [Acidimicrobiales bacterium]|nr:glycosyltransferase [Acidimicrobiales bacterium]